MTNFLDALVRSPISAVAVLIAAVMAAKSFVSAWPALFAVTGSVGDVVAFVYPLSLIPYLILVIVKVWLG